MLFKNGVGTVFLNLDPLGIVMTLGIDGNMAGSKVAGLHNEVYAVGGFNGNNSNIISVGIFNGEITYGVLRFILVIITGFIGIFGLVGIISSIVGFG